MPNAMAIRTGDDRLDEKYHSPTQQPGDERFYMELRRVPLSMRILRDEYTMNL